jgi:hypothetical protein
VLFTFDLQTPIVGQAAWTNDPDGVQRAILDISTILGVPNCCPGGGGGGGIVDSVVAGAGISVDNTDPANPVVSATGGGGTGDVVGPASSGTDNIPLFADTTGKVIKDSGISLDGVVTTDGNPAGVSPIASGSGVAPIELRRFVNGTGIEAQANTGSVQFNQSFTGPNRFWYGAGGGVPTETDITPAGRALLDDVNAAAQRNTLGLGTAATADTGTGSTNVLTRAGADTLYTPLQGAPDLFPILATTSGTLTAWTNMPAALTFFLGQIRWVFPLDLTNRTQIKLSVLLPGTVGSAGSKIRLLYRLESGGYSTNITDYVTIGTSEVEAPISTASSYQTSGWIDIVAGARAQVLVAVAGIDGDGAADPQFIGVWCQSR